ncbi:MAG: hypothetical protein NVS3B21_10930 [Acidimicrobiales bacterium]
MNATTTTDIAMIVDTNLAALTETDEAKRAVLIEHAWAEDGSLTDPPLAGEGHAGINDFAKVVCEHYAGQRFRRISGVDVHHNRLRYAWALVTADGTVTMTGTDVGDIAPDGRLRTVTGFFGDLPPA